MNSNEKLQTGGQGLVWSYAPLSDFFRKLWEMFLKKLRVMAP